jgi:hypothetical protein
MQPPLLQPPVFHQEFRATLSRNQRRVGTVTAEGSRFTLGGERWSPSTAKQKLSLRVDVVLRARA